MELPDSITDVVDFLSRLPGVGNKSATRQTLALMKWPLEDIRRFGSLIEGLSRVRTCEKCSFFCEADLCTLCTDKERASRRELCVVENVVDLLAIEKSGEYRGPYHILGAVLNPLLGVGPEELGLGSMAQRIGEEGIESIIVAVNPSVEGDATASYIREILPGEVKVERIGFGIPIGGALEYLDSMTITKALENRKRM